MTQVFTFQLNQIESAEHSGTVVTPGAQQVEGGETALVDHIAVNRTAPAGFSPPRQCAGSGRRSSCHAGCIAARHCRPRARMWNPSCLILWIQSGPAGGSLAGLG